MENRKFVKWGFALLLASGVRAGETVDFEGLRRILKNDRLDRKAGQKNKRERQKQLRRKVNRYRIPDERDFWTFFSEYWVVKNASVLKWDLKKPDYGIEASFRDFLESLGLYEKRFKILFVDSADVSHFALPSDGREQIFLLSIPFVKVLNLSKLEISLLLLEDLVRAKQGYFKNYATSPGLKGLLGGNFFGKKFESGVLRTTAEKYRRMIFDKGFNFEQQFRVTEQTSLLLKNNAKLRRGYRRMLAKIDRLVKSNAEYKKYLRIYPSPELQLNWLSAGEKNHVDKI